MRPIRQPRLPAQAGLVRDALLDEPQRQLLGHTKTELQPLNVEPIPTDISALLSGIAEYATALCARQDNQFQYRLPTTLPKLMEIDGRRLQQVLLNLLSNASKFTREGTVTLTVSVIPLGQRCRIGFDVSDTGIGIDLTRQTDIFGAFKQIQAVNGGTGLGLFIAQRIVSAMGGELGVASSPGHGTSFSFEFTTQALEHETTSWPNVSHFTPVPSVATQPHCRDWVDTAVPPKADRDELAKLAEQGRLTDIEQWIGQFSDVASYSSFLAKVRLLLARLDFFGIEALVAAADHASHEQD